MLRDFFDNEAVYLDGRVWDGADFGVRGGRLDTFPWGAELESAPAGTRALARFEQGECVQTDGLLAWNPATNQLLTCEEGSNRPLEPTATDAAIEVSSDQE